MTRPFPNITDYIITVPKALSAAKCKTIIAAANTSEFSYQPTPQDGEFANITITPVSGDFANTDKLKKAEDLLLSTFQKTVTEYLTRAPSLPNITKDTGYSLYEYSEDGFYSVHTDTNPERPPTLCAMLVLEVPKEGGELMFFNGTAKVEQQVGSVIIFPSNFLYPHSVGPVVSGSRKVVLTWLE